MTLNKLFLGLLSLYLLSSCAQIVPPTGGPKDTSPPEIVETDLIDSSIHFKSKDIYILFDEVIKTSGKVVQISPLIQGDFETKAIHKTLKIKVPIDSFAPNTTYTISLRGIQDVTEGNTLSDVTYLVSTGTYLDSLVLNGLLKTAEENTSDTSSVYLYRADEGQDAILSKRPAYISHPTLSGNFVFQAIPPGEYRLFALSDQNNNYIYDPGERIGFYDKTIELSGDTVLPPVLIYTWIEGDDTESKQKREVKKRNLNKSFYSLSIDTSSTDAQQDVYSPLKLDFAYPIDTLRKDLISCTDTSAKLLKDIDLSIDTSKNVLELIPTDGWEEGHVYKIFIKEDALQDSSGRKVGTHYFFFTTLEDEDYSTLLIHFTPLDSNEQYICYLEINGENEKYVLNRENGFDIYKAHARGAKADLTYFLDKNRNGIRDNGNLDERLQHEVLQKIKESFLLKKNWDHIYTCQAETLEKLSKIRSKNSAFENEPEDLTPSKR